MGYLLFLGTSMISWIPAVILVAVTILPYTFVTGMFLTSIFFHICSFLLSALFWFAFQRFDSTVAYIFAIAMYAFITNCFRMSFHNTYKAAKNRFFTVGANVSLHPTHNYHVGYAAGLGWGISEAFCFYGSHLLGQVGGISLNAALYPSVHTKCGQFTPGHTPFPTVFGTAIQFFCVLIINICFSFMMSILREWFAKSKKYPSLPILFFFSNLSIFLLHFAFYLASYIARSSGFCNTALVVPPSITAGVVIFTSIIFKGFHSPEIDPHASTLSNLPHSPTLTSVANSTVQESLAYLRTRLNRPAGDAGISSNATDPDGGEPGDDRRPIIGVYNQFHDSEDTPPQPSQEGRAYGESANFDYQRITTPPPNTDQQHNYNYENDYGEYNNIPPSQPASQRGGHTIQ